MTAYSDTITGTSGLTNYWRFEGNGTATTGSASMTIASGYSTGSAGREGNGLTADSNASKTGSYTTGVANTFFDNTYSIELWFKTGQHRASQQEIMRMSNELALEIDTAGKLYYYYNATDGISTATYDDNAWHHLVVTRDSSRLVKAYVDGTQVFSFTAATGAPGSANLYLAGSQYSSQPFITGQVDEVALYNVALTSTQVTAHKNVMGTAGYSPTPMTASAAFPGGAVPVVGGYTATPMTASATMPTAHYARTVVVQVTDDAYTSTASSGSNFGNATVLPMSSTLTAYIKIPAPTLSAGETILNTKLGVKTTATSSKDASVGIRLYRTTGAWTEATVTEATAPAKTLLTTSFGNAISANGLYITNLNSALSVTNTGIALATDGAEWDVYSSDTATSGDRPYVEYLIQVPESSSVNVDAQPMTGDAALPTATVTGGVGITHSAAVLTASADMPAAIVAGQRFYTHTAEPLAAFAETPQDSHFGLPVTVNADPITASGDVVAPTVGTAFGVIFYPEPLASTVTWNKPATVNGNVIVLDETEDKYFQRVFGFAPKVWQRLNDTGSTAVDRMATYNGVYSPGVQTGRHDGPDERASVHFVQGSYLEQNEPTSSNADEAWIQDGVAEASTLEFSFRTSVSNVFLMAGADKTQTSAGVTGGNSPSSAAARELFLTNGKLTFRSRIFAGTPDQIDKEFTGTRNLADGQWHHVVVKSGVYSRGEWGVELWIDGTFEARRFNANGFMGFPDFIGFRPNYIDGSELEVLPLSQGFVGDMTEVVFYNHNNLQSHDIARNYYALMGWTPVAPEPMNASAAFGDDNKGKGSQKKALYLYWTRQDEVFGGLLGAPHPQPVEESLSFDPMPGLLNLGSPNVPNLSESSGDFFGFKVFSKSITVNYSTTGPVNYRDPITDDPSLINLESDIDLSDYDVILFKDWPDEGYELEWYETNFPGQKERLLNQLRDANDDGVGLYVTNPRLAIDLGIVDRIEFVSTLQEEKYSNAQGAALGYYDYGSALKFPWNIVSSDGLSGGLYATGVGVAQDMSDSFLSNKAYFYFDTNANNRFRVRAAVEGLTDLPGYMIEDAVWHTDYDQYGWQGVAYKYLKRDSGLLIGDEFIFNGSELIDSKYLDIIERRYNRFNGTWATPAGHVKAGTVVTTFGAKHWVGKSYVDNPYANYATTIVVQPGDTLNGRSVGGRIFVNFTEQPNQGLGVVSQKLPSGSTGWPREYGPETTAQREWDYSWTRTSLSSTNAGPNVQTVSVALPDGTTASVRLGSGGDNDLLSMVRSSQLFPLEGHARLEMDSRGMYWLGADVEEVDPNGAVVRATAMSATVETPQPQIIAHKSATNIAQAMLVTANMPRVVEDTYGDVDIRPLPFTADVTFTGYGKTITAEPLLADGEFVEPFDAVHAGGENASLILHNYEATLILKEEA